ncbi:MAG: DegT/DnrJ/EryC1/StrS family aminotransferase [Candidatus Tectomicrobia bacterium]|nr:DegT/DnrJ/EryC1/StrS family aminotransferase [Candidatus Tectomicrobia bacterium]
MLKQEDGVEGIPFVDLAVQYESIQAEIDTAMQQVLEQSDFILGRAVHEFEQAFAQFVEVEHAIGVSNGLDALRLALMVLDIGPGDEVILPANTYIATALAVSDVGARPVLVDCDPATYNLHAEAIDVVLTPRTRAIIPVHLTGQAADMDAISEIANQHGVAVIEDAAQAQGTRHRGRPCGSLGTLACFSFYPGKNLGAYGDAGLLTTHDARLAERLRQLRNYGQSVKYEHTERGVNTRLDTLQAAILNVKLRYLPQWNQARARHAENYRRLLCDIGDIRFQQCASYSTHIYHLLIIETAHRDALQRHLTAAGIQTGIHYPKPIHLQPAYGDLGYRRGDFPHTERLADRMLSLPMFPELREEQLKRVVETIQAFFI